MFDWQELATQDSIVLLESSQRLEEDFYFRLDNLDIHDRYVSYDVAVWCSNRRITLNYWSGPVPARGSISEMKGWCSPNSHPVTFTVNRLEIK